MRPDAFGGSDDRRGVFPQQTRWDRRGDSLELPFSTQRLVVAFWLPDLRAAPGTAFTVFFFGAVSFWALREYVTITPTRLADHKMLVGVFFVLTPLQFLLVGVDPEWFVKVFRYEPYYFYSAMIPSLAFLILPACVALSDDKKYF